MVVAYTPAAGQDIDVKGVQGWDFSRSKWNSDGLIPVVVQDVETQTVLMVAYMNEEALKITLQENRACYFSRSRQSLWRKGETSGHVQEVVSLAFDCDYDTLLLTVKQTGNACHEDYFTCFHNILTGEGFVQREDLKTRHNLR